MLVGLAIGALAPASAVAQQHDKSDDDKQAPVVDSDGLTSQDRQVLNIAKQCSNKVRAAMEEWIKSGRVSEERLFAYLYFPIPDTDPVKFSTDYDQISDAELVPIQEDCLAKAPGGIFVVTVDKNGYLPTHNLRYSQALTGHKQIDLVNNRTKRIFNDRTGIRAARNTDDYLLQAYQRDTGEVMKDLSVPIYVNGKHWGGIRFGFIQK
jgi:methyl-accepting chemotaxis protein